jgi:hypothetical protein
MSDNVTPFYVKDYDEQIRKMMPFYDSFHAAAITLSNVGAL